MVIAQPQSDPVSVPPSNRRWWRGPGRVTVLLGAAGVAFRLVMLLAETPATNSDEATSALVAAHIAEGRALPLFFYGQYYMGALESYLAAPLFALGGTGALALRLPNLLLYAAFLALVWQLTRRLYTPWLATATVGLLALGSDRVLKNQLISGGGYPEMNPAGTLLVLLAVNLGLGVVRRRVPAYAGFGLVAGLTLWDDWLVLPYVGVAGLLLLVVTGRDLWGRAGAALGAGLLLGLVPIVVHNLTAPPAHRSLAVYRSLSGGDPASWSDRLYGGVLFGLPMGTGFCDPSRCQPWQLVWGVAWPVLLVVAGVLAVRSLRSATGADRVRAAGRLALVVGGALTLLAYATSAAAGNTPVESARYLSCLLISTPAVLWPLWSVATDRSSTGRGGVGPLAAGRVAVSRRAARVGLAAVAAGAVAATVALVVVVPETTAEADRRRGLVAALDRLGVDRFYAEYWTCLPVVVQTDERIVCAVIGDDLRTGWDRYPAYREQVRQAPRSTYVLATGSPLSARVADRLRQLAVPVTLTSAAGYDIYRADAPVPLPEPR